MGWLFGTMFPDDCRLCRKPLAEVSRAPVCAECLASLEPAAAEFQCARCHTPFANEHPLDEAGVCRLCRTAGTAYDAAYSYGAYDGNLKALIHLLKYGGVEPLAPKLARLMLRALPRERGFDVIVPVPMHWVRQWRRGFNQADLLARECSRALGIRFATPLRRLSGTRQAGLTLAARRRNVTSASFEARQPVAGQRVLLVDDVLTTGATARAAALVLKRAGAAHVSVLTLARAERRFGEAVSTRRGVR